MRVCRTKKYRQQTRPLFPFLERRFMKDHFREINIQILKIFSDASDTSNPQDLDDARHVIDKLREAFAGNLEQLGLWETAELNYADRAIDAGFFRLAMISAVKAISIHQLSPEEYAFGFCLVGAQHKSFMNINNREKKMELDIEETRIQAARILKSNQEFAAQALSDQEQSSADKLYQEQQNEARALEEHDSRAAERLKSAGLNEMNGLSFFLNQSQQRVRELERLLAMMSGAYSVERRDDGGDAGQFFDALQSERENEAQGLKKEQSIAAENLKIEQREKARFLKAAQDEDAKDLKTYQLDTATELVEAQTVKDMRKGKKDTDDKG